MNDANNRQDLQHTPSGQGAGQSAGEQPISRSDRREARQSAQGSTPSLLPWIDVFESDDSIVLLADLPGVPKDKLELRVENNTLQIEGEIAPDTPEQIEALYAEVRASRYSRAFSLSAELDTDHIEAQLRDGVLQLRIPKHAHAQPRRIEVTVA